MRKRTISFVVIISGLFLWGCYPNGPSYTEDLDIVITHHNPDYNFVANNTYAMPDKILKITGNLQEGDVPQFIPDVTATQILSRIASNLLDLGWERVALDAATPHILLAPASIETTTVYYYDWWYWGYYPYYPYYPVYAGSYTTGTLIMTMMDPLDVGGNGNPIQEWTGLINGVLTDKFDPNRVNPLIDKAFEQSPYLDINTK